MISGAIAKFVITAFCLCNICVGGSKLTSAGTEPVPMFTAACDTRVMPIGTIFTIRGNKLLEGKEFMCQTRGGAIVGRKVDIFLGGEEKHSSALRFGVHELDVEVVHSPTDKRSIGVKKRGESWRCPMVMKKKRNPLKSGIGIATGVVLGEVTRKKLMH